MILERVAANPPVITDIMGLVYLAQRQRIAAIRELSRVYDAIMVHVTWLETQNRPHQTSEWRKEINHVAEILELLRIHEIDSTWVAQCQLRHVLFEKCTILFNTFNVMRKYIHNLRTTIIDEKCQVYE